MNSRGIIVNCFNLITLTDGMQLNFGVLISRLQRYPANLWHCKL